MKVKINMKKVGRKVGRLTRTAGKFGVSCAGGFVPMAIASAGANVIIPGAGLIPVAARFGIQYAGFSIGFDATEDMINKASRAVSHKNRHHKKDQHTEETKTEENNK